MEDLVAPLLFVAVGILMLFTGISGGTTHAPEAGLGVIALLFGLWSLGTTIAETRS